MREGLRPQDAKSSQLAVRVIASKDELPLYENAALATGYVVEIIPPRVGQTSTSLIVDDESQKPEWIRLEEGDKELAIIRPDYEKDHATFWQAFEAQQQKANPHI